MVVIVARGLRHEGVTLFLGRTGAAQGLLDVAQDGIGIAVLADDFPWPVSEILK
jgi:hypothetical protein